MLFNRSLKLIPKLQGINFQAPEGFEANAFTFPYNSEQDVLGHDLIGPGMFGLLLGKNG